MHKKLWKKPGNKNCKNMKKTMLTMQNFRKCYNKDTCRF